VRACVRACMRACVRACVCACVRACVCEPPVLVSPPAEAHTHTPQHLHHARTRTPHANNHAGVGGGVQQRGGRCAPVRAGDCGAAGGGARQPAVGAQAGVSAGSGAAH